MLAEKEYKEFASLVKRMRKAQNEERKWGIVNFKTEEDKVACGEAIRRMYQLESEVDEYLKKKITSACRFHQVEIQSVSTMEQLGKMCGIAVPSATAADICD